jgi:aspartate aminotransferase
MINREYLAMLGNKSVIRELSEYATARGKEIGYDNVFDFSLGNPSVPAPEAVKEAAVRTLETQDPLYVHGYMLNSGFEDVRTAVADDLNGRFGSNLRMQDIIMTCGAATGINVILHLFLDPGDEVIAFAPFFGEYRNYVIAAGGVLKVVPADTQTFQLNIDALDAAITKHQYTV